MPDQVLLYGANGYTGKIIAGLARDSGLSITIAGRNASSIEALSSEHNLPYRVFDLDDVGVVRDNLKGFQMVMHCAGPFAVTCQAMARAAIDAQVHYIDITGEISVFEHLHSLDQQARDAGIMILPGAGFDVVPTDCLAARLKARLPDASKLELAFQAISQPSAGTAKSAVRQMPEGGRVRRDGKMITVPHLEFSRRVTMNGHELEVHSIPWGDVYTSYISTDIPDITVYTVVGSAGLVRALRPMIGLLKIPAFRSVAEAIAGWTQSGPGDESRSAGASYVWGRVENATGHSFEEELRTIEGYEFTAHSALEIARRIVGGDWKPGFATPSLAYGSDLVLAVHGSEFHSLREETKS